MIHHFHSNHIQQDHVQELAVGYSFRLQSVEGHELVLVVVGGNDASFGVFARHLPTVDVYTF